MSSGWSWENKGSTSKSSGGWSWEAAPSSGGGGGLFGFLGSGAHWLGSKLDIAGRDIEGIPGGLLHVGEALGKPLYDAGNALIHGRTFTPSELRDVNAANATGKQLAQSTYQALEHPLRDPFQTALTVLPAIGTAGRLGEAGVAAKAAEGGLAERAAAAAKALTEHGGQPLRTLTVGEDRTPVTLIGSRNPALRFAQRGYDRMLQRALDREQAGITAGRLGNRVATHAWKRVAGAGAEELRLQQRMAAVPSNLLDASARKLAIAKLPFERRIDQAALELTSQQVPAEEAAAYHYAQAAKNVSLEMNRNAAKLYEQVAKRGLVHVDETRPTGEKVFINPAKTRLAATDAQLAKVQKRGDTLLARHEIMSPEELQARVNAPGRIRAGARYEAPTPGKLGIESPTLRNARAYAATVGRKADAAFTKFGPNHPETLRFRAAQSVAAERVQKLEAAAARRVKPTGIIGGETARPGRGYTFEGVSEKKLARTEAARSQGPVHGVAREPISKKPYTGRALEHGLRPKDVTGAASRHLRMLQRFENTDRLRRYALTTGSDIRRSEHDGLLAIPDAKQGDIPAATREAFGQRTHSVDTLAELGRHAADAENAARAEGLRAALEMRLQQMRGEFRSSQSEAIGTKAPDGYRWVNENEIRSLLDESPPRGGVGGGIIRVADDVNSAVTAATVYLKIGHSFTRVFTNAATNLMQGSLGPLDIARSLKLWNSLNEADRARMLAAAGQHGFASLPAEARDIIGHVASRGAQFWARHADAPFRFNSLAYELRKAGYTTAGQVRSALDALEHHGDGVPAHEWAKISTAARRSDREGISYDRLNSFERRYLTRLVWFYPWIKGSTVFTVRSMLEHPYKMGAAVNAGVQGRQIQEQQLGPTPSYEAGLIPLTGAAEPLTTDFSTFSPFGTAGQVGFAAARPQNLAGFLNPVAGATSQLIQGLNAYGAPSKRPYLDALLAIAAATPEQQLAEAYAARGSDQSGRMFQKTPGGTLLRYLLGPAYPRHVNKSALAKAAARELSGQR